MNENKKAYSVLEKPKETLENGYIPDEYLDDLTAPQLRVVTRWERLGAKAMETAAMTDSLTHVESRAALDKLVTGVETYLKKAANKPDVEYEGEERRLAQPEEAESLKFSIIFIDLNHFKDINETLGHSFGDHVLEEFATRLQKTVRDTKERDRVFRFGGDEFAVLTEAMGAGLAVMEQRIQEIVDNMIKEDPRLKELGFGASIGSKTLDSDRGDSLAEVIHIADQEMFEAKRSSKGQDQEHEHDLVA